MNVIANKIKQNNIAIDAEWEELETGECLFLTTQIAISNDAGKILEYFLFINEDLYDVTKHSLEKYRDVPVNIIPWQLGKVGVIEYFDVFPINLNVYLFHSPVDCECFLGRSNWTYLLENGFVNKRKNLYIRWNKWSNRNLKLKSAIKKCKLNFIDSYGRVDCSLGEAYDTLGIDTSNGKDYIKEFNVDKSKMSLFFQEHPKEFMEYSLGDLNLHLMCVKLFGYIKDILKECFDLESLFDSVDDYPASIGSLVNKIFLGFLEKNYGEVLNKLSYLSTSPNHKKAARITKILNSSKKKEEVKTKILLDLKGVIHGLGAGSIPAFFPGNYDRNGRSPLGAIVHGGRTVKEDRTENVFHDTFDIDLKSAYGSALTKFDYPLGLPSCVSVLNSNLSGELKLRKVLTKYKKQLVNGLYTIYVSGNLLTQQDFLVSKYGLTTENISIKLLSGNYEDNDDTFKGRLGGEVVLTTKQIELSVLTSDNLELLQKVCSSNEWGNILNLDVDLLVYYPKSKELSINKWLEKHSINDSLNTKSNNPGKENRTSYWCRFSLSEFLSPLLTKRNEYKKFALKSKVYKSKQKLLKLLINTVYGDLASPYFPIGNTVVANNITARVRTQVWMIAKALGTKVTITDGGFYEYKKINCLKTKGEVFYKPSLGGLFSYKNHEYIRFKPLLEDFDFETTTAEEIDELALNHIKEFWSHYKLNFDAEIEHKFENISKLAIVNPYTKADYYFLTYEGKEVWKIRGVKSDEIDIHPKAEIMRSLRDDVPVRFHASILKEILGVNQYIKDVDKNVLPGHVRKVQFVYKPNRNNSNLYENFELYKKACEAHRARVGRYEKKYAGLELELIPRFKPTKNKIQK